jgi:hypothetical protein
MDSFGVKVTLVPAAEVTFPRRPDPPVRSAGSPPAPRRGAAVLGRAHADARAIADLVDAVEQVGDGRAQLGGAQALGRA